jgi:hypothetical protein
LNFGFALPARAEPSHEDILTKQEAACENNVQDLRGRVDKAVLWSNVFMIAGAIVSALGAGLAGFLSNEAQRKTAAVVGALGAVLTVMPKALPDKSDLEAKLSAADKHHTVGVKIRNQFAFASANESLTNAEKYASARFTDCAALDPPANVPDFPVSPPSNASNSQAADVHAAPGAEPPATTFAPAASGSVRSASIAPPPTDFRLAAGGMRVPDPNDPVEKSLRAIRERARELGADAGPPTGSR